MLLIQIGLTLLVVLSIAGAACGVGDKPTRVDDLADELGSVAAFERGRPALVFVYTDG